MAETIITGKEAAHHAFQPHRSDRLGQGGILSALFFHGSLHIQHDRNAGHHRHKAASRKLYPALLYALTKLVNRHDEFRTAFNRSGELGIYGRHNPLLHGVPQGFGNLLQYLDTLFGGLRGFLPVV